MKTSKAAGMLVIALMAASLLAVAPAKAQTQSGTLSPLTTKTLNSPNPGSGGGNFGYSVSSSGSLVVVGAPYEYVGGLYAAGNVYVFSKSSGALLATLSSPDVQAEGYFGFSVSTGYGIIVVGAPNENSDDASSVFQAGNAYVYNANTFALMGKITDSSYDNAYGETGQVLGWSVAAGPVATLTGRNGHSHTGNIVVVGEPGNRACSNGAPGDGDVWTLLVSNSKVLFWTITCSVYPTVNGGFGDSVAVGDGVIAAGGPFETVDSSFPQSGLVMTYGYDFYFPFNILVSPHTQSQGEIGWSIAVNTLATIAVGAPGESFGTGDAYTFNGTTSALIKSFSSPDFRQTGNDFGTSIALGSGAASSTLLVGADDENIQRNIYPGAGHAYSFDALSGALVKKYSCPTLEGFEEFGAAVAVGDGGTAIVGAPQFQIGIMQQVGRAYIF